MRTDLVPIDSNLANVNDRQQALAQLAHDAEHAATPEEAQEIMIKGRTLATLLTQVKAPFEEARLAGKASVMAAKRLGRLLNDISPKGTKPSSQEEGWTKSPRREIRESLGITKHHAQKFIRLARIDAGDFERYIQRPDIIPSLNGALVACSVINRQQTRRPSSWREKRRTQANVKTPPNPTIDEGYALIVKALGHLSANAGHGSNRKKREISEAVDHLYAAEDLLKKYRGGYIK